MGPSAVNVWSQDRRSFTTVVSQGRFHYKLEISFVFLFCFADQGTKQERILPRFPLLYLQIVKVYRRATLRTSCRRPLASCLDSRDRNRMTSSSKKLHHTCGMVDTNITEYMMLTYSVTSFQC